MLRATKLDQCGSPEHSADAWPVQGRDQPAADKVAGVIVGGGWQAPEPPKDEEEATKGEDVA